MDVDNAAVGIPQSGAPTPDKYKNRVLTISMHEEVLGQVEVDVKPWIEEANARETDLDKENKPKPQSGKDGVYKVHSISLLVGNLKWIHGCGAVL